MTWQDIYKGPYTVDPYGIYMFAGPDPEDCSVTALDCTDDTGAILTSLCNFLNHEIDTFQPKIKHIIKDPDIAGIILETGDFISVRGWGYLTGVKDLSGKEAKKIQDDFLDYIVDRINKAQEITGLY